MYACNLCNEEFPYLIFEYNSIVCEKCSIHKNIKNCDELTKLATKLEENPVVPQYEEAKVEDEDIEQLLDLIEQIKNPQIREDFFDLADQYLQGY